jgi:hypothetical protein
MDGILSKCPVGSSTGKTFQSQATFKMLRRLHGQNLESQGLNNLSEEFQSFVTRAKFFSLGKLRRTWYFKFVVKAISLFYFLGLILQSNL